MSAIVAAVATISSASTTQQITAAYLDNCGYLEDDDLAMARRFVTAVMAMLARGVKGALRTLDGRPPAP